MRIATSKPEAGSRRDLRADSWRGGCADSGWEAYELLKRRAPATNWLLIAMVAWLLQASALTAHADDTAVTAPQTAADPAPPGDAQPPVTPDPPLARIAEAVSGFFLWTDTSVSVLPYGWEFEVDPSKQSALTFEHAHESVIGDMFAFIDLTKFHDTSGDDTNWYGEIGPRLSAGKILKKDLSFSILRRGLFEFKDVLIAGQYERGEDTNEAEAVLLGIGFDLDVREAGILGLLGKFKYIQLNLYARAELADSAKSGFRDMQVTMVAGYPFEIGAARFLVDGYFDWVVGFGSEDWSYHLNPQIKLDLGHFWGKPEKLYVGVEPDFWWNKYQIPSSSAFESDQQAVSLMVKYHF